MKQMILLHEAIVRTGHEVVPRDKCSGVHVWDGTCESLNIARVL